MKVKTARGISKQSPDQTDPLFSCFAVPLPTNPNYRMP